MATCQSCGSDVNGAYCNTCGTRVQEERAAKKQKEAFKPSAKPAGSKGGGWLAPQRITRVAAMGLLGIALFGGGMITGFYMASTNPGSAPANTGVTSQASDPTGLPPIAIAGKYMDEGVDFLSKNERSAATSSFRKAIAQYEQVIKEEPGNLYAQSYMGLTYYYMGDSNKALSTLREVLNQDGNYLWALFNLAWIYETGGKTNDAILMYQKYLAAAPAEKENKAKYAEQIELVDRQVEAATKALEKLKGGIGK